MKVIEVVISNSQHEMRLDLALVDVDIGMSRRKIREVIDVGGCYVNKKRMRIASRKVYQGDKVRLEFSLEGLKQAKKQDFEFKAEDILYEDRFMVAVNKPPGLVSQATRTQSLVHVEAVLKNYYKKLGGKIPALTLVHRLDKETSGVILLAKDNKTANTLMERFRSREMQKTYWAAVKGILSKKKFKLKCQLSAINKLSGMVSVLASGGKTSETSFNQISANDEAQISLIECFPKTGRSHQIRVHLDHLGLPIIGDKRYGNTQKLERISPEALTKTTSHHLLHARQIVIPNIDQGKSISITAPLPPIFEDFLKMTDLESK